MNKELQDLAWSVLPKEFKEEVKELYDGCIKMMDIRPSASEIYANKLTTLESLFGIHNLTSDAEGEEMLTVPRNKVQELYAKAKDIYDLYTNATCINSLESHAIDISTGKMKILDTLFGSKCLPDDVATSVPNVDSSVGSVESLEPKPAEPKFKVGDKASYVSSPTLKHKCTVTKVMQNEHSGKYEYNVMFEWRKPGMYLPESDLEPYTEPEENIAETRNFSQDCDKDFDNILKDSFSKERRLNVAVQLTCAMIPKYQDNGDGHGLSVLNEKDMIKCAYRLADMLIAEAEKGGLK